MSFFTVVPIVLQVSTCTQNRNRQLCHETSFFNGVYNLIVPPSSERWELRWKHENSDVFIFYQSTEKHWRIQFQSNSQFGRRMLYSRGEIGNIFYPNEILQWNLYNFDTQTDNQMNTLKVE